MKLPRELVLWGCRRGFAPGVMKGFAQDGAWNRDARRMSLEGPNSDQTFLWLHFAVASPVLAMKGCAQGLRTGEAQGRPRQRQLPFSLQCRKSS